MWRVIGLEAREEDAFTRVRSASVLARWTGEAFRASRRKQLLWKLPGLRMRWTSFPAVFLMREGAERRRQTVKWTGFSDAGANPSPDPPGWTRICRSFSALLICVILSQRKHGGFDLSPADGVSN